MDKVIKRGYVKWTDDDGVFHKEPLADHPDLLSKASPQEKLAAEEARRLNAAAEDYVEQQKADENKDAADTLKALQSAPEEVHTAADLFTTEEDEQPAEPEGNKHEEALKKLQERTAE